MLAYRNLNLASSTDSWAKTGVRDDTGAAGEHVGQQYELRARYDFLPNNMFLEVGGAYLVGGEFLDRAPNSPHGGDHKYGFVEMRWTGPMGIDMRPRKISGSGSQRLMKNPHRPMIGVMRAGVVRDFAWVVRFVVFVKGL